MWSGAPERRRRCEDGGQDTARPGGLRCERQADDTLLVHLVGHWTIHAGAPVVTEVYQQLDASPPVRRLAFAAQELTAWDSRLLTLLRQVWRRARNGRWSSISRACRKASNASWRWPPPSPSGKAPGAGPHDPPGSTSIGTEVLAGWQGARDMLGFIGEAVLACLRLVVGKARFRRVDLVLFVQECGVQALGIVTLISFLIGLILAFMGAVQLRQFGAQIFVADLVGLGMTREMGAS